MFSTHSSRGQPYVPSTQPTRWPRLVVVLIALLLSACPPVAARAFGTVPELVVNGGPAAAIATPWSSTPAGCLQRHASGYFRSTVKADCEGVQWITLPVAAAPSPGLACYTAADVGGVLNKYDSSSYALTFHESIGAPADPGPSVTFAAPDRAPGQGTAVTEIRIFSAVVPRHLKVARARILLERRKTGAMASQAHSGAARNVRIRCFETTASVTPTVSRPPSRTWTASVSPARTASATHGTTTPSLSGSATRRPTRSTTPTPALTRSASAALSPSATTPATGSTSAPRSLSVSRSWTLPATRSASTAATATLTARPSASRSPSISARPTATATGAATPSSSAPASRTPSAAATVSPSPSVSLSPSASGGVPVRTATVAPSATPLKTASVSPSLSHTSAATPSTTAAPSRTATAPSTLTVSGPLTASVSRVATVSATSSPSTTSTNPHSRTSTIQLSVTASALATLSASTAPSPTVSRSQSMSDTARTASRSFMATPTLSASATPSRTPAPTASVTPSGSVPHTPTSTASTSLPPPVRTLTTAPTATVAATMTPSAARSASPSPIASPTITASSTGPGTTTATRPRTPSAMSTETLPPAPGEARLQLGVVPASAVLPQHSTAAGHMSAAAVVGFSANATPALWVTSNATLTSASQLAVILLGGPTLPRQLSAWHLPSNTVVSHVNCTGGAPCTLVLPMPLQTTLVGAYTARSAVTYPNGTVATAAYPFAVGHAAPIRYAALVAPSLPYSADVGSVGVAAVVRLGVVDHHGAALSTALPVDVRLSVDGTLWNVTAAVGAPGRLLTLPLPRPTTGATLPLRVECLTCRPLATVVTAPVIPRCPPVAAGPVVVAALDTNASALFPAPWGLLLHARISGAAAAVDPSGPWAACAVRPCGVECPLRSLVPPAGVPPQSVLLRAGGRASEVGRIVALPSLQVAMDSTQAVVHGRWVGAAAPTAQSVSRLRLSVSAGGAAVPWSGLLADAPTQPALKDEFLGGVVGNGSGPALLLPQLTLNATGGVSVHHATLATSHFVVAPLGCPSPAPMPPSPATPAALLTLHSVSGCHDAHPSTGGCDPATAPVLSLTGTGFRVGLLAWVLPGTTAPVATCSITSVGTAEGVDHATCALLGIVPGPHAAPAWNVNGAWTAIPSRAFMGRTAVGRGCPLTSATEQCHGHGVCAEAAGSCTCHAGNTTGFWADGALGACSACAAFYAGDEAASCRHRCPGAVEPCSGHGVCSAGHCACSAGWGGPDCGARCPVSSRSGAPCGAPVGVCHTTNGTCGCPPNFAGAACDQCAPGLCGAGCTPCPSGPGLCASVDCGTGGARCDNATGLCVCRPFFFGPPGCAAVCPGLDAANVPCSGHGVCTVSASGPECHCSPGWVGAACAAGCPLSRWATACGGGSCVFDGTAAACVCPWGWAGAACDVCAAGHYGPRCTAQCPGLNATGSLCNGHGSCDSGVAGTGRCVCSGRWSGADCGTCQGGWFGPDCDRPCPSSGCGVCSGHGSCSDGPSGTGLCACDVSPGVWSGPACGACAAGWAGAACAVRCPVDSGVVCGAHGVCDDGVVGSGRCGCDEGFVSVAGLCDACAPSRFGATCQPCPVACGAHGTCDAGLTGTGGCRCAVSHAGPLCATRCPGGCSGHGRCDIVGGAAQCTCDAGWGGAACAGCAGNRYGPACAAECPDCGAGVCRGGPTGDGTCDCPSGFGGPRCLTACPRGAAGNVCSGHGTCLETTGACRCYDDALRGHWANADCAACAPSHAASAGCALRCPTDSAAAICGGRGVCSHGQCACPSGSCGAACDLLGAVCSAGPSPCQDDCSGHGYCAVSNASWECVCSVGYAGTTCSSPCPGECSGRGACSLEPSGAVCHCHEGHWGPSCAGTCPVSGGLVCSGHGLCGPTGGCVCWSGFGGPTCAVACPTAVTGVQCSGHGVCGRDDGTCRCAQGFGGGDCAGCVSGLSGPSCAVPCAGATAGTMCLCGPGFGGPGCAVRCPTGLDGALCSGAGACTANGTCACGPGRYGPECAVRCTVDHCRSAHGGVGRWDCGTNGTCACSQGSAGFWAGLRCDVCAEGYWGAGCQLRCPCHMATCDRTTGECFCYSDPARGFWARPRCDRCAASHVSYIGGECRVRNDAAAQAVVGLGRTTGLASPAAQLGTAAAPSETAAAVIAATESAVVIARGGSVTVGAAAATRTASTECWTTTLNGTVVAAVALEDDDAVALLLRGSDATIVVVLRPPLLCPNTTTNATARSVAALAAPVVTHAMPALAPPHPTVLTADGFVGGLLPNATATTAVFASMTGSTLNVHTLPALHTVVWWGAVHGAVFGAGSTAAGSWVVEARGAGAPTAFAPPAGSVCDAALRCTGDGTAWLCMLRCSDAATGAAVLQAVTPEASAPLVLPGLDVVAVAVTAAATVDGTALIGATFLVRGDAVPRPALLTVSFDGPVFQGVHFAPAAATPPTINALARSRSTPGAVVAATIAQSRAVVVPVVLFAAATLAPPVLDATLLAAAPGRTTVTVTGRHFSLLRNATRPRCWFDTGSASLEGRLEVLSDSVVRCGVPALPDAGCSAVPVRVGDDAVTTARTAAVSLVAVRSAVVEAAVNAARPSLGAAVGADAVPQTVLLSGRGFVPTAAAVCGVALSQEWGGVRRYPATVLNTTHALCSVPAGQQPTRQGAVMRYAHDGTGFGAAAVPFAVVGTAAGLDVRAPVVVPAGAAVTVAATVLLIDAHRNALRGLALPSTTNAAVQCTGYDAAGAVAVAGTGALVAGVAEASVGLQRPALGTAVVACTALSFAGAASATVVPGPPAALALVPPSNPALWAATAPTSPQAPLTPTPTVGFVDGAGHPTAGPGDAVVQAAWTEEVSAAGALLRVPRTATGEPSGPHFVLHGVAVRGVHGSVYTVTVAVVGNTSTVAAATFPVTLAPCAATEYAVTGTATCAACPPRARCDGTAAVTAQDGYWRAPASLVVYDCPSGACLGEERCRDGYEGVLCGTCASGFGRVGDHRCGQCTTGALSWCVIALAVAVLSGVVYVLARRSVQEGLSPTGRRNPVTVAAKLLIGHLQLAAVMGGMPEGLPSAAAAFFAAEKRGGSPVNVDVAIVTCVLGGGRMGRLYTAMAAVAAVAVGAALIYLAEAAVRALTTRAGAAIAALGAASEDDVTMTEASLRNRKSFVADAGLRARRGLSTMAALFARDDDTSSAEPSPHRPSLPPPPVAAQLPTPPPSRESNHLLAVPIPGALASVTSLGRSRSLAVMEPTTVAQPPRPPPRSRMSSHAPTQTPSRASSLAAPDAALVALCKRPAVRTPLTDTSLASVAEFAAVCGVVALFLGYPTLVDAAAGALRCRTVVLGPTSRVSLLRSDLSIDCGAAPAQRVVAGVLLAALGVLAPLLSVAAVRAVARFTRGGDMAEARGVLFYTTGGYTTQRWWWESVLMLRKAVVVAAAALVSPERLAFYSLQWALCGAFLLSFYCDPFTTPLLTNLESASLAALLAIASLVTVFEFCGTTALRALWAALLFAVCVAAFALFAVVTLRLIGRDLPHPVRRLADRVTMAAERLRATLLVTFALGDVDDGDLGPGAARYISLYATVDLAVAPERAVMQRAITVAAAPLVFQHEAWPGRADGTAHNEVGNDDAVALLTYYDTSAAVLQALLASEHRQRGGDRQVQLAAFTAALPSGTAASPKPLPAVTLPTVASVLIQRHASVREQTPLEPVAPLAQSFLLSPNRRRHRAAAGDSSPGTLDLFTPTTPPIFGSVFGSVYAAPLPDAPVLPAAPVMAAASVDATLVTSGPDGSTTEDPAPPSPVQ